MNETCNELDDDDGRVDEGVLVPVVTGQHPRRSATGSTMTVMAQSMRVFSMTVVPAAQSRTSL